MSRIALKAGEFGSSPREDEPLRSRRARMLSVLVVLGVLAASAAMLVVPPTASPSIRTFTIRWAPGLSG